MTKNCDDCIKNNRKPNAVGCIECSVVKKKKKKIRDLTITEVNDICQKNKCEECPFNVVEEDRCMTFFEISTLDLEVEVEEDDR